MKRLIFPIVLAASILALGACKTVAPKSEEQKVIEILMSKAEPEEEQPAEPMFDAAPVYPFYFILSWEANPPEDNVTGYNLYLGEETLNYVAKIPLPNITEQKVMNNHPVTYCAVAAVNAVSEGPLSDEIAYVRHPIP